MEQFLDFLNLYFIAFYSIPLKACDSNNWADLHLSTQWLLTLVGMQLQYYRTKKINVILPYEWLFFTLCHDVPSILLLLTVVPDIMNTFRVHTLFVIVFGKIILQAM